MDDIFQKAQRGDMSVRVPRLPPATFHLSGLRPDVAASTAHALNQRSAHWSGVALQFAAEPLPGSIELPMDAKAPVVTQPQSPKAAGQAAALFLECVRCAGGDPWRLNLEGMPYALGIAHAFLCTARCTTWLWLCWIPPADWWVMRYCHFGSRTCRSRVRAQPRFQALEAGACGTGHPCGRIAGSSPFVSGKPCAFGHGLEDASSFGAPRLSGRTFEWMPEETGVASADLAVVTVSGAHGTDHVSLERLTGTAPVDSVLAHALALEYAWVPGRSERRRLPATLEWARGLLYQKDRFGAFAPGRFEG
ncbi:MAG: hypothetical protein IPN71_22855 [Fibrobacteres bacterium]|nr:hypothetical protein [Fibrobacterota bacterium]